MPSARYLLVEGVDGHLVSDPLAPTRHGDPARYVGWELLPKPAEDVDHAGEHYKRAQQVHLDHGDLQRAVSRGGLRLVDHCIAKNHEQARALMKPKSTMIEES